MVRFMLRQSSSRLLIRPLIAAQVLLGIPVAAAAPASAPARMFPTVVDSLVPAPQVYNVPAFEVVAGRFGLRGRPNLLRVECGVEASFGMDAAGQTAA
jgi:hypothetical protein